MAMWTKKITVKQIEFFIDGHFAIFSFIEIND